MDPNTGDMVDPVTGAVIGSSFDDEAAAPEETGKPEEETGDTKQQEEVPN